MRFRLHTLLLVSIGLAVVAAMLALSWVSYSYINDLPPIKPIPVPAPPGV